MDERYEHKIESELICTMLCIKNNLSLSFVDNIPSLLKMAFTDSNITQEIKCGGTKATALITDVTGPFSLKKLSETLQKTSFSMILDESTDVSSQKNLVIVVRFYDVSSSTIVDKFLGHLNLDNASAKNMLKKLLEFLEQCQIQTNNIIGLSTDNAAVMSEKIGGLQKLLSDIVANLFYIGCTCHNLQLCSERTSF